MAVPTVLGQPSSWDGAGFFMHLSRGQSSHIAINLRLANCTCAKRCLRTSRCRWLPHPSDGHVRTGRRSSPLTLMQAGGAGTGALLQQHTLLSAPLLSGDLEMVVTVTRATAATKHLLLRGTFQLRLRQPASNKTLPGRMQRPSPVPLSYYASRLLAKQSGPERATQPGSVWRLKIKMCP